MLQTNYETILATWVPVAIKELRFQPGSVDVAKLLSNVQG